MLFTVCGKMFCSWHFQLPSQLYQHCLDAQSLLFFLFFAQLCYGFLPHEPTNWKFKRLKFCTLYQCLQSFSPAYTDQWSPQPINSPKGWRGRKKVCTPHNNKDWKHGWTTSPWRDLVLGWPIPTFILTLAFAKLLIVKIMKIISL